VEIRHSHEANLQESEEKSVQSGRVKMEHYATYYFANIIDGILTDHFTYIRSLNDFYGEGKIQWFAKPFQKYSAFHQFIDFVVNSVIDEQMSEIDLESLKKDYLNRKGFIPEDELKEFTMLPLNTYFHNYKITHTSFEEWLKDNNKEFLLSTEDDIYDYYNEFYLSGEIEDLIEKIREEVFFVMFSNRGLLRNFNVMMANVLSGVELDDLDMENQSYFKENGILKRVNIPSWTKKAVFYRDRGRCVKCNKDISGTLSFQNNVNFDHIVPLAVGGLNDVTNIQLMCEECNKKKNCFTCDTSIYYEKWY
jgi:hypothetical protein